MRTVLWFVKLNFPFRPSGASSRILIFCFAGLSFLSSGLSANPEDSLRKALVKATDDKEKVQIYLSLAKLVKTDSPDSCLLYLDEAQKLFRHINSLYYLGEVNEIRGDISRTRNDFNEAVRYYKVAIYCYAKKGDKKQQVKLLNFIGGAYAQTGNLSEAFRNYLDN